MEENKKIEENKKEEVDKEIKSNYDFKIIARPDYAFLRVMLKKNQSIDVEAGAMASMDTNVTLNTRMKGEFTESFGRILTGESLFISTFTAEATKGEICLAPGPFGDIGHYYLERGRNLFLQSKAYLASSPSIKLNADWEGFKGFFISGINMFLIKVEGEGDVFFNSYGSLIEVPVKGEYIIDTGYVVAFEDTLTYNIHTFSLKTGLFGGEFFACKFQGEGKIWIQARQVVPFIEWVDQFRRVERRK